MLYSEKVRVFLTRHNMEPERIDLAETTAAFLGEMELGLRGRESSLKMLPTYLTADGVLPMDEPAAVIDAGGTNFRTALVSFTEAGPVIDSLNVCAMPGTDGAVTWEDFISFAADRLSPAARQGVQGRLLLLLPHRGDAGARRPHAEPHQAGGAHGL